MTTRAEMISRLAPPQELVDWLEEVFELRRQKGQRVPERITAWLEFWKAIQNPSIIDPLSNEEWESLRPVIETVGAYVAETQ